jgi:hypothetical protein
MQLSAGFFILEQPNVCLPNGFWPKDLEYYKTVEFDGIDAENKISSQLSLVNKISATLKETAEFSIIKLLQPQLVPYRSKLERLSLILV